MECWSCTICEATKAVPVGSGKPYGWRYAWIEENWRTPVCKACVYSAWRDARKEEAHMWEHDCWTYGSIVDESNEVLRQAVLAARKAWNRSVVSLPW